MTAGQESSEGGISRSARFQWVCKSSWSVVDDERWLLGPWHEFGTFAVSPWRRVRSELATSGTAREWTCDMVKSKTRRRIPEE